MLNAVTVSRDPLWLWVPPEVVYVGVRGPAGGAVGWWARKESSQLLLWLNPRGQVWVPAQKMCPTAGLPKGPASGGIHSPVPALLAWGLLLRRVRAGSGRESLRTTPAGVGSGASVHGSGSRGACMAAATPSSFISPASPNCTMTFSQWSVYENNLRTSPGLSFQPYGLSYAPPVHKF